MKRNKPPEGPGSALILEDEPCIIRKEDPWPYTETIRKIIDQLEMEMSYDLPPAIFDQIKEDRDMYLEELKKRGEPRNPPELQNEKDRDKDYLRFKINEWREKCPVAQVGATHIEFVNRIAEWLKELPEAMN